MNQIDSNQISGDKHPGFFGRLFKALQYTITGATEGWFPPLNPLPPIAQDIGYRTWDYSPGINIITTPKTEDGVQGRGITFEQLRNIADNVDLLRIIIEKSKDSVAKMDWDIVPQGKSVKLFRIGHQSVDAGQLKRINEVRDFLRRPDGERSFMRWIRVLLEDMFVIDASTVKPVIQNGKLVSLKILDGSTIKLLIDQHGSTPDAPSPAYQQILKGMPAVDYTKDDLLYMPYNSRSNRLYGFSPVEQIIITVNTALRKALFELDYFTEGNIPEGLCTVPADWTAKEIADFQKMWDTAMVSDLAQRRRIKFVPNGMALTQPKTMNTREDMYNEWLARIICFAFSVSPTPFIKQVNRATAESAIKQAIEEGIQPRLQWIREMMNDIIWRFFGYDDIEFAWAGNQEFNQLEEAQKNVTYVKNGILTIDEVRDDLGRQPFGVGPMIITGTGGIPLNVDNSANNVNNANSANNKATQAPSSKDNAQDNAQDDAQDDDKQIQKGLAKLSSELPSHVQDFVNSLHDPAMQDLIDEVNGLGKQDD